MFYTFYCIDAIPLICGLSVVDYMPITSTETICNNNSSIAIIMVGGLFYNNLVAENPAVAAFGKMPFGQGTGILGNDTEVAR